jgi:4-amino-4-deoxy-L-arabinose transferase-like glycosyltransferase
VLNGPDKSTSQIPASVGPEGPWGLGRFLGEHGWWLPPVLVALFALWLRPVIPPDETRYLDVAWEMWSQKSFFLPLLNGQPYTDKPPLLFWLIQLGWLPFGVNEWWPRLLPALQAIGNVYLVGSLARLLWPEKIRVRLLVMWMLAGTFSWMVFASLLLFDMLLVTWALLALIALARAAATMQRRWHLLFALCVTLGILSKGPVILLHILPTALLARWWAEEPSRISGDWYLRTGLAVIVGAAACLLWVVPAAIAGGPEYTDKILWYQTAGRVRDSFAHSRPAWFYILAFPALMAPWVFNAGPWRGLLGLVRIGDRGTRFVLSGLVPALLVFSLISGKQIHYVLPLLPGALLLAGAAHERDAVRAAGNRVNLLFPALSWVIVSMAAAYVLWRLRDGQGDSRVYFLPLGAAVLVLLGGLAGLWRAELLKAVRHVSMAGGIVVCLLVVAAFRDGPLTRLYDTGPAAAVLALADARGADIASVSGYHGEFTFGARLRRPVIVIPPGRSTAFCAEHRDGVIIDRSDRGEPPSPAAASLYEGRLRNGALRVWACP